MIDLKTRKPITRPKVTPIPVTDTVIKAVEALAERDGVKSFKFFDRNKINIDHDSFIAGVQEKMIVTTMMKTTQTQNKKKMKIWNLMKKLLKRKYRI